MLSHWDSICVTSSLHHFDFVQGPNKKKRRAYDSALLFGAGNRVRTGDLNLGKVALYQLSYSRAFSKL